MYKTNYKHDKNKLLFRTALLDQSGRNQKWTIKLLYRKKQIKARFWPQLCCLRQRGWLSSHAYRLIGFTMTLSLKRRPECFVVVQSSNEEPTEAQQLLRYLCGKEREKENVKMLILSHCTQCFKNAD